jgi:hypothetical protein
MSLNANNDMLQNTSYINLEQLVFNQPLLLELIGNFLSYKDIINFRSVNKLNKEIFSTNYIEKNYPISSYLYKYGDISFLPNFQEFFIEKILPYSNNKIVIEIEINTNDSYGITWKYLVFNCIKLDYYNYKIYNIYWKYDENDITYCCINNEEYTIYNIDENKINENIIIKDRYQEWNDLYLSCVLKQVFNDIPYI